MILSYNISIHQISRKNEAKPYQCILDQKAKLISFKVESLAQLNVWGNVKKLVIVKLSVKHKVK